jgi:hypothetical protein
MKTQFYALVQLEGFELANGNAAQKLFESGFSQRGVDICDPHCSERNTARYNNGFRAFDGVGLRVPGRVKNIP